MRHAIAIGIAGFVAATSFSPAAARGSRATLGFAAAKAYPGGVMVVVGDFNEDGHPDVVSGEDTPNLLLGTDDGSLHPGVSLSGGTWLAAGDLDSDGHLDLVGLGAVRLGRGDGTFGPPIPYDVGVTPTAVALGDLDGDGRPDLVLANFGDPYYDLCFELGGDYCGSLSVLLGNGDGSFRAGVTYHAADFGETSLFPSSVALADFNGDGHVDLVFAGGLVGSVDLLLGAGDGSFQPSISLSGGGPVAAADLDGDGRLDLVNGNVVRLGNGNGSFRPPVTLGDSINPYAVAVGIGDVNGDGHVDLAIPTDLSYHDGHRGRVSVFLGRGDGTFELAGSYPTDDQAMAVALVDLNADGHLDLVAAADVALVWTMMGRGDGRFIVGQDYFTNGSPESMAVGDFDEDGTPDVAVAEGDPGTVSVLLSKGDGAFASAVDFFVYPGRTGKLLTGDLNGDGHLDLIVGAANQYGGSAWQALLGNGDGTFGAPINTGLTFPLPFALPVLTDMDGDGIPDLVNVTRTWLGNGDGTFRLGANCSAAGFPRDASVGDFNGDGKPDLAVVGASGSTAPGFVSICLGNGDGSFQPAVGYDDTGNPQPAHVTVGDVNGDGFPDLVVDHLLDAGWLSLFLGRGDGTFQPASSIPYSSRNAKEVPMAIADLNGDGIPDLALTNAVGGIGLVALLLGNGDGTFKDPVLEGVAASTVYDFYYSLSIADINGDGRPDLLVASSGLGPQVGPGGVTVLLNTSNSNANLSIKQTPAAVPGRPTHVRDAITVTNSGPDVAFDTVVTDLLPPQLIFVSCATSGDGVCGGAGSLRAVSLGSLEPGATARVEIEAMLDPAVCGITKIANRATASSAIPDLEPSDNAASTKVMLVRPCPGGR